MIFSRVLRSVFPLFAIFSLQSAQMSPASAEPTPLVSRFMNAPVSLFDWGIYRNDVYAKEIAKQIGATIGGVSYDFKKNRISIYFYYLAEDADRLCAGSLDCIEKCGAVLERVGSRFYVKLSDGDSMNIFASYFTRAGYTSPNFYGSKSDDAASKELAELAQIEIKVGNRAIRKFECSRELTGERVSISR